MTDGRMWSVSGRGGTLEYGPDGSTRPGPYYMLAVGDDPLVGSGTWKSPELNERAVHGAVLAYQRALNRELGGLPSFEGVVVDGLFGEQTAKAVTRWQRRQPADRNITVWGGIGQQTSKYLLMPTLETTVSSQFANVVCGIVTQESQWDAGCVGYTDPGDLGLGQISEIAREHDNLTERNCFQPITAFSYVEKLIRRAMDALDDNLRDAIAAYNLGIAGAQTWIRAGRPDIWKPSAGATPRDVRGRIDTILSACAETARSTP